MNWWQVAVLVSVCTAWTCLAALVGASIANTTHAARDVAEAAKWQVPK